MQSINQKVLPSWMPFNKSLRKVFALFCGITILVMGAIYLRRTSNTDTRNTDIHDRTYLWQNTSNPLKHFSGKVAVENMQSPGKKIFIAFDYWEQLTMGTNNFFDLTALASYGGRQVVVPLVNDSKFHGLPTEKGIETLDLYYNVSVLNRTLRSRGHGTLISWKKFQDVCQGKLDVLVRIDYTKLKKTTARSQAKRPFFPCNDSGHTDTISTDFKVERTVCMNVFALKSVEKFENEVVKRLPCVGLDQWRGSIYRSRHRAQFQLSKLVTNRLRSPHDADGFFNPKLLHIAQDFFARNLGPLFFSVHVRAERILGPFKDISAVVKCLSNLVTQVQSHKKDINHDMPVFLAADFAGYGSSSKQVKPARENAESLMKILAPLKPVIFQPSVYNLTDRGTVAIVEMNILVSGKHLSLAGGGTFQAWILKQFANKNNLDQRSKANCRSKMCNFCYL